METPPLPKRSFFHVVVFESLPFLFAIFDPPHPHPLERITIQSASSQEPQHPTESHPPQPRPAFANPDDNLSHGDSPSRVESPPQKAASFNPAQYFRASHQLQRYNRSGPGNQGSKYAPPQQNQALNRSTVTILTTTATPLAQKIFLAWQLFTVVIGAAQLLWTPIGNGSVQMTQDPVSRALRRYSFPPVFLHQAYLACLCCLVVFVTSGAVLTFVPTKTLLRVFGSTICIYGRALWYFTMIALSVPIISTLLSVFLCGGNNSSSHSSVHQIDPSIQCWSSVHIGLIIAALLSLALFYYAFVAKRMEVYSKLERAKASSVGFFYENNPVHFFSLLTTKTIFCLVSTFLAQNNEYASVLLYLTTLLVCIIVVNARISFVNVRAHGIQSGLLITATVSQMLALTRARVSPLSLFAICATVFFIAYVFSVARACWPKYVLLDAYRKCDKVLESIQRLRHMRKRAISLTGDQENQLGNKENVDCGVFRPPPNASIWNGHHHHHHNQDKKQDTGEDNHDIQPDTHAENNKAQPDANDAPSSSQGTQAPLKPQNPQQPQQNQQPQQKVFDKLDLTSAVGGAKYLFQKAWCPALHHPGDSSCATSWLAGIRALVLRSNQLAANDTRVLCQALSSNAFPLESLDLSRNLIDPTGAEWISQLISHANLLRFLNLNENGLLESSGFQTIVENVLTTPGCGIRKMWFDFCGLDGKAAHTLVRILNCSSMEADACCLTEISVRGNNLNPEGASILAPCLRTISPCNMRVHMEWNHFRREGVSILLHAMAQNPHTQVSHSTTWNVARLGFQMNGLTRAEMAQVMDEVRVRVYQVQCDWDMMSNHSSSIHSSIEDDDRRMEMEAQASLPERYPGTLVEAVGGESELVKVVDDFYYRLVTDPQLRVFFRDISMNRMRHLQYAFLYSGMSGHGTLNNASLRRAHRHLGLTDDHFDATIGHLVAAIYQQKPDFPTSALLNLHSYTESLRPDIAQAGDSTGSRFMNRDAKSFLEMYAPKPHLTSSASNPLFSRTGLSESVRFNGPIYSPFSTSPNSFLNLYQNQGQSQTQSQSQNTPTPHLSQTTSARVTPSPSPAMVTLPSPFEEHDCDGCTTPLGYNPLGRTEDMVRPFSRGD